MTTLLLRAVEVAPGRTGLAAARSALARRLEGVGPPVALVPRASRHISDDYCHTVRLAVHPDEPVEDGDTVVVLATSGSTGTPRGVCITRDNLVAAVESSWEHVPGLRECAWAVALPVTSIAGFATLVRAHLADTPVHSLDSIGGAVPFTPDALMALPISQPFAISLVPTQLSDVLASPGATRWLADATAVMVGGAMTPRELTERARDAGIRLVTTYGMTETTGGCVYDGVPLPGVTIEVDHVDPITGLGRISLAGPAVAAGYRLDPVATAAAFTGQDAHRRFTTADRGSWHDGRLDVSGRLDDVVSIHGVNVGLDAVEAVVRSEASVHDVAVVAVPDRRAGHRIIAFVVLSDPSRCDIITALVADRLGGAARPDVIEIAQLPLLSNGKIDRHSLRALAQGDPQGQ